MKNYWAQKDFTIAAWHADVRPLLDEPDALVALVRAVYEAGHPTRLILPVDGVPSAAVEERWKTEKTIDLFRMIRTMKVEAELAYYDRADQLVEGRVVDLGLLLAELQPVPNSISHYDREVGEPPVALTGQHLVYEDGPPQRAPEEPVTFTVALHSDIWFPYVVGFAHPNRDLERFFDNRELARENGVRLNELLTTIKDLVTSAGGRWYLDTDDLAAPYAPWLSDEGVRLHGPAPALMPASEVDVPWPPLTE